MSRQSFNRPDMKCSVCGKTGVHAGGKCGLCYQRQYMSGDGNRNAQNDRTKRWRMRNPGYRSPSDRSRAADLEWMGRQTPKSILQIFYRAFDANAEDLLMFITEGRMRTDRRKTKCG